jgi:hypothetical protein
VDSALTARIPGHTTAAITEQAITTPSTVAGGGKKSGCYLSGLNPDNNKSNKKQNFFLEVPFATSAKIH